MRQNYTSVDEYISQLPDDRQTAVSKLRSEILQNLPSGFAEVISYGMIGYVVPHSLYPSGYHCDPELPLPFINLASQKNFVALYHMGIYADPGLLEWFTSNYPAHTTAKLDMGKSCIRFKKIDEIPFALIGELAAKWTPADWINRYEQQFKKRG